MKKIILLSALSLISINVLAYQGSGYKIISESVTNNSLFKGDIVLTNNEKYFHSDNKGNGYRIISKHITVSPGFKGGFTVEKNDGLSKPNYTDVSSGAYKTTGRVNDYITLKGYHGLHIVNQTSSVQRYKYTYTLQCAQMNEVLSAEIEMKPKGSFTDTGYTHGVFQTESPGVFTINVLTEITGSENARSFSHNILTVN